MFYRKKQIRKILGDMEIGEGGVVKRLRGNEATLRALQDLGIAADVRISRVWEKASAQKAAASFQVGDRRVSVSDLLAGSVEVAVPKVCRDVSPMPAIEGCRINYLKHTL